MSLKSIKMEMRNTSKMETTALMRTSNSARWLQDTGGLFDKYVPASEVDELVASLADDIPLAQTPQQSVYDASSVSGSVSGSISASPAPYATEGMFDFSEDTKPEQTIAAESILPSTSANEAILDDETMEGFADLTQFILGDESLDLGDLDEKPFFPMCEPKAEPVAPAACMGSSTVDYNPDVLISDLALTSDLSGLTTISMDPYPTSVATNPNVSSAPVSESSDIDYLLSKVQGNETGACVSSKSAAAKRKACGTVDTTGTGGVNIIDHEGYTAKKIKTEVTFVECEHDTEEPSTSDYMTKAEKYRNRRDKNNIASKRSRETRKSKYANMMKQGDELEMQNEALRKKVAELEAQTKEMKALLVKELASRRA